MTLGTGGGAFSGTFSGAFSGAFSKVESISATSNDNYKAKVMRHMLPPPYKQDFGAVIPSILTAIGQSDNLIGGLFGAADFLPDEG